MQVRIGVADAPSSMELEVENAQELLDDLEQAFSEGRHLLRFTDVEGRLLVVPLARLAYLEVEAEKRRWVGFSKAE